MQPIRQSPVTLLCMILLAGTSSYATADEHRHEMHDGGHAWHGHFHDRDIQYWQSGHWRHGNHGGHLGWWWTLGGLWYFYPEPVYPYPDPYRPPVVVVQEPPVSQPAPPVEVSPGPVQQYWYYCTPLQEYYPYVPTCPVEWKAVPAKPPR